MNDIRRKVPRLDTTLTFFGMPLSAFMSAVFGGLIALQIAQTLVSTIWLRGLASLVAVVLAYRGALWFSDRYGNGFGMRFVKFLTRADYYDPSEPQKEVPLTFSRAGLPEKEREEAREDAEPEALPARG